MDNLIDFLNRAARHYYNGTPIISDDQFDELARLANYSNIGARQHDDVDVHYKRMYSLQKYYEGENNRPLEGYVNLSMTPKLDGAAVSVLYVEGKLTRVLTRGDGLEGRLVTDKFLATKLLPHVVKAWQDIPAVQVTGEIAAPKHVENSRNYAAGALNLGSTEEFKSRAITFFAYGVYPYLSNTFTEDMQLLTKCGFNTVQDSGLIDIYPTDGVVFRVDDNKEFESLGYTSKHPRGAYARKERGEAVETILLDVEWNVGKTGKVTPTAILEPIMIGDKQVSRATLNNPGFIEALDLRIGDRVAVIMGGEIIPVITHKVEG